MPEHTIFDDMPIVSEESPYQKYLREKEEEELEEIIFEGFLAD